MQLSGLGMRLLSEGIRQRDVHLADAAMTFLLPNYAMLANLTIGGLLVPMVAGIPGRIPLAVWFGALLGGQVLYFVLGVFMAKPTKKLLVSLAFAPAFLLWKVMIDLVSVTHLKETNWVRTERTPSTMNPLSSSKAGRKP